MTLEESVKVPVGEMVWAAPISQVLIALEIWPKLTRKQRCLVASCRTENPGGTGLNKYRVQLDGITAEPRTLRSLKAKGVVDERGQLTEAGVYAALWGRARD